MRFLTAVRLWICFASIAILSALSACGEAGAMQSHASESSRLGPLSLAVVGYNYTDRYIDTFTVNGQGGGNLYVSSETSGGGGTVCCVMFYPGTNHGMVRIRWQHGACYYREYSTSSTDVYETLHSFFREERIAVPRQVPAGAKNMEIHFYPDGTIQIALTATESAPRFKLSKSREDNSRYPWCPNEQKPVE